MANIEAAGAVVTRPGGQVLLVHRPKYDDWSFPKGKLDPGEHAAVAAVREVAEETGLRIRLGPPLASQAYPVGARTKSVHYWTARVVGEDDVDCYVANDEIDEVVWVHRDHARELLTYAHDRDTLEESVAHRRRTRAMLVVRHGTALDRKDWDGEDRRRPLGEAGFRQAQALAPVIAAYDVTRVVSSSSTRCVQTMRPYTDVTGWLLETTDVLSEEGATVETVAGVVEELLDAEAGAAVCSHRPVLPTILDAIGLDDVAALAVGEVLVVHHREGRIVAHERHRV